MSDQRPTRGAHPGQPAPLDPGALRTIKSIAFVSLAVAVVALLVSGVLYIRVKSVVLDHTDGLNQKIDAVAENSNKAMDRMANMNSEVNSVREDLAALEDKLPSVVGQHMVQHAMSEMEHKAGFLAAHVEDEQKRDKVVKIMALLAELQGKKPKAAAEDEAAAAPTTDDKEDAAAEPKDEDAAAAAPAADEQAEPAADDAGDTEVAAEESMETPPMSHELAKAEEHATAGEPPKSAKSEEAAGEDLDAKAEADAYHVDEQAMKMVDEAVTHLEKGAEKLAGVVAGATPAKEGEAQGDKQEAKPQGDQLEAKAEDKAYKVDAAAKQTIHEDTHKLVQKLEETMGKLGDILTGDTQTGAKAGEKEPVEPDAAPKAKPESKGTAVDSLVQQLQEGFNLQPVAAPGETENSAGVEGGAKAAE